MSENFIEIYSNNLNYFIEKNDSKKDFHIRKNNSIFSHSDKNVCSKLNLFKLQKNYHSKENYFDNEKETKSLHEIYINNTKNNKKETDENKKETNKNNSKFSITQSYYSYSEISSLDLNTSKSSEDV